VLPIEPVPSRDAQLRHRITDLQRQQLECPQWDGVWQQLRVPRWELCGVHRRRDLPADGRLQDGVDLVRHGLFGLRRQRQQSSRHVLWERAVLLGRQDDRRSGLQLGWAMPRAGSNDLLDRNLQFVGNRLPHVRLGTDVVQRHVLRRGTSVLQQRVHGARHHGTLRLLHHGVHRGASLQREPCLRSANVVQNTIDSQRGGRKRLRVHGLR
jgi:hypothetical protein